MGFNETASMRLAMPRDLEAILPLMRGYYRDDVLRFDEARARTAMSRLLAEPQWGRVILIEIGTRAIGYVAVCIGFTWNWAETTLSSMRCSCCRSIGAGASRVRLCNMR